MTNKTNALIISNNEEDFSILNNIISKFKNNQYQLDWIQQTSINEKEYFSNNKYGICFVDYNLKTNN
jgi:hypothetical protein